MVYIAATSSPDFLKEGCTLKIASRNKNDLPGVNSYKYFYATPVGHKFFGGLMFSHAQALDITLHVQVWLTGIRSRHM